MKFVAALAFLFQFHSALAADCDFDLSITAAKKAIESELKTKNINAYFLNDAFSIYEKNTASKMIVPYYYYDTGDLLNSIVEVDIGSCTAKAYPGMPSTKFRVH